MKAARIHGFGNDYKIVIDDINQPICNDNQVILQIYATSINHLDLWVKNRIPGIGINLPFILGSDACGIIIEVGCNVKTYKVGDKVIVQPGIYCGQCYYCKNSEENSCVDYGILGETQDGTHCEFITINPKYLYIKPSYLTYEQAAAVPLVFMTAYEMLKCKAKLLKSENILIYGGTSGVGNAAIKIAKAMGANIISTVGSINKINFVKKSGANEVLLHTDNNLSSKVKSIVGDNGIQVVFEHVGASTWNDTMRVLSKGGRVVTCGATTGFNVNINLQHLFYKQLTILGSTMSTIKNFEEMLLFFNKNKIIPSIDKVYKLSNINDAINYMEERKHKGKIVISINEKSKFK